jgi:general secretion pathway protein G
MKSMINKLRNREGSTLIEVIVVVVILAILAAVMLPRFFDQTDRANVSSTRSDINSASKAVAVAVTDSTVAKNSQAAIEAILSDSGVNGVTVSYDAGPPAIATLSKSTGASSPASVEATVNLSNGNISKTVGW